MTPAVVWALPLDEWVLFATAHDTWLAERQAAQAEAKRRARGGR